jgi:hypothetical protein
MEGKKKKRMAITMRMEICYSNSDFTFCMKHARDMKAHGQVRSCMSQYSTLKARTPLFTFRLVQGIIWSNQCQDWTAQRKRWPCVLGLSNSKSAPSVKIGL